MTRAVQIAELGDQNVFTVDSDNNRIGIGTTNPQALLQVGTGVSVYGNSGIVSAKTYYGSGAELTLSLIHISEPTRLLSIGVCGFGV